MTHDTPKDKREMLNHPPSGIRIRKGAGWSERGSSSVQKRDTRSRRDDDSSNELHSLKAARTSWKRRLVPFLRIVLATMLFVALVMMAAQHTTIGNSLLLLDSSSTDPPIPIASNFKRFPLVGSTAFLDRCPWTPQSKQHNCTLFFRPKAQQSEGIAHWVSITVQSHLQARQMGCRLLVDYGTVVQLQQVLEAPPTINGTAVEDWNVPSGFECNYAQNCYKAPLSATSKGGVDYAAPSYRNAYKNISLLNIHQSQFQHIPQRLQHFDIEIGFACSFNSIFRLAPSAAHFQHNLWSDILPILRNPHNLVVAVYIRSGFTDYKADIVKQNGTIAVQDTKTQVTSVTRAPILCAQSLEQQLLLPEIATNVQNVIWMLVTDSPTVKRHVIDTFHETQVQLHNGTVVLPRMVLTTGSTGTHSRPSRNPSTVDFAESIIDWYLIGESNIVVTNGVGFSFGTTAAMRTNRSLYLGGKFNTCSELSWLIRD